MANTSATGGALLSLSGAVPADLDFDVILGRLVRGITGLAPGMVRPRWQEKPPQAPPKDTNWCAIGVMRMTADGGSRASIIHNPADEGTDTLRRYEMIEVMASFYGPGAGSLAALLRDGLALPQNREPLFHAHASLVDVGPIVNAPSLVNTTFQRRQDITFRIRRRIDRTYAVRSLREAVGTLSTEPHDQAWSTEN